MEIGQLKFHRRAFMAFSQLSAGDQANVLESLTPLAGTPIQQWPPRMVTKLRPDAGLYLLRLDDSLRAIVSAPKGVDPEVLDLVRHETLQNFAKAGS